jgi:hypothetical protein
MRKQTNTLSPKGFQSPKFSDSDLEKSADSDVRKALGFTKYYNGKIRHIYLTSYISPVGREIKGRKIDRKITSNFFSGHFKKLTKCS